MVGGMLTPQRAFSRVHLPPPNGAMGLWANPLEDAANEDGGSLWWLGPHATKLVQHKGPVARTPPLGGEIQPRGGSLGG